MARGKEPAMLRDEHRLREKIDLSLDERQLAPLALALLLLIGAVFAIGVYVGKGLARGQVGPAPAGNLEALDARKDAAVVRPGAPPAPHDDAAAREKQKAEEARKKAEADKAAEVKRADDKAAREKAAAAKAEEAKAAQEAAANERRERERKKAAARERALAAAAAAREKAEKGSSAAAEEFTVQIGSVPQREEADRIAAKARAAGYEPEVIEADLGDKGTWYRVRVGSFSDKAEADKLRKDLEKALGGKALVMPAR